MDKLWLFLRRMFSLTCDAIPAAYLGEYSDKNNYLNILVYCILIAMRKLSKG